MIIDFEKIIFQSLEFQRELSFSPEFGVLCINFLKIKRKIFTFDKLETTMMQVYSTLVGSRVQLTKKLFCQIQMVWIFSYNISITPAAPCPVPTHIVTTPYF